MARDIIAVTDMTKWGWWSGELVDAMLAEWQARRHMFLNPKQCCVGTVRAAASACATADKDVYGQWSTDLVLWCVIAFPCSKC